VSNIQIHIDIIRKGILILLSTCLVLFNCQSVYICVKMDVFATSSGVCTTLNLLSVEFRYCNESCVFSTDTDLL